jgi:hypothetical protein
MRLSCETEYVATASGAKPILAAAQLALAVFQEHVVLLLVSLGHLYFSPYETRPGAQGYRGAKAVQYGQAATALWSPYSMLTNR